MTPNKGRALALGLAALGAAACLLLVLGHWSDIDLPGCRAASPCALAAESPFSESPIRGWPTAALALAYFAAWIAAAAAGPIPSARALRWTARLALLGTLAYTTLAIATRLFCPYCFAAHTAIAGLWALAERARRGPAARPAQWLGALTLTLLVFAGAEVGTRRAAARRDELEFQAQVQLKEAFAHPPAATGPSLPGRYPLRRDGKPDRAAIEVVVFTGYQCPECSKLESALQEALAAHPDTALTIRHFPFCADCNRLAKQTIHPNACWAARAAETAGILRGTDGFWAMHRWLFERHGAFTDAELTAHLADENYDAAAFTALLQSDRTLDLVKQDVDLAAALALNRTPTVFVNNVEVKLWNAPTALNAAINEARAALRRASDPAPQPTPGPDLVTTPPTGLSRLLAEWRDQPKKALPPGRAGRTLGPAGSPIDAVLFGDHQDDGTARLDARLRALAADGKLRYTYRHFPADQKCNPTVPRSFHPLACRLARTAEAAGQVGGEDAFWKVHTFILEHHQAYTDADLRTFAAAENLDAAAILKARDGPEASAAVEEDVAAGKALGVAELPWLILNGRRVPRWEWDGKDILEALIAEAAETHRGEGR